MDDSASSGRTNILKKIIGFLNPSSHEDDVTEEEIISMVNEGHEQGVLRASEAEMIHNIFEFGDKEAKDIMTHRKNLIAIDGELSYNDVWRHPRLPGLLFRIGWGYTELSDGGGAVPDCLSGNQTT